MSFTNNLNSDTSSIIIESDFNIFNTEMEGGKLKNILESSEEVIDTSSVDLNSSEMNLSDSDMEGGKQVILDNNSSDETIDTSSVDLNSSEMNLSDSDMEGGKLEDSSEIMVDTSSVDLNSSEMNLSDSDMEGGMVDMETLLADSNALAILFSNYDMNQSEKNADLKEIVLLSTKILANMIKIIKEKNFYKTFDAEKKFLSKYHENMGKFLLNQNLNDLNDRDELKNILNINTIAIVEVKELINKNSPEILSNSKISKLITELLEKIPKL